MASARETISVLLVDDHPIFLSGLRNVIAADTRFSLVGEATDGRMALQMAKDFSPDVVLLDIGLPQMNGIEVTRALRKISPRSRVLVLTIHNAPEYAVEVLKAGAQGYLLKTSAPEEVLSAIEKTHGGQTYFSPSVARLLLERMRNGNESERQGWSILSDREREILRLIAQGHTSKVIASTLSLSARTVQTHRQNIMRKLDLYTTADLTKFALKQGILEE